MHLTDARTNWPFWIFFMFMLLALLSGFRVIH